MLEKHEIEEIKRQREEAENKERAEQQKKQAKAKIAEAYKEKIIDYIIPLLRDFPRLAREVGKKPERIGSKAKQGFFGTKYEEVKGWGVCGYYITTEGLLVRWGNGYIQAIHPINKDTVKEHVHGEFSLKNIVPKFNTIYTDTGFERIKKEIKESYMNSLK